MVPMIYSQNRSIQVNEKPKLCLKFFKRLVPILAIFTCFSFQGYSQCSTTFSGSTGTVTDGNTTNFVSTVSGFTVANPLTDVNVQLDVSVPQFWNGGVPSQIVWINEFHYQNTGPDVGEFVEIGGVAGTNLSNYSLVFYNGLTGNTYGGTPFPLSGTIDDESQGIGAVAFPINNIQNGNAASDGIALVENGTNVIEFMSYGSSGSFVANNGPALGMTSTHIFNASVVETNATPTGVSIQRRQGAPGEDFSSGSPYFFWAGPFTDSPGSLNVNQIITPADFTELTIILKNTITPTPTEVILVYTGISYSVDPCTGGMNINATFDDSGSAYGCTGTPSFSGDIQAYDGATALSTLGGTVPAGDWQLMVMNNTGMDVVVNSWTLDLGTDSELPTIATCPADMTIEVNTGPTCNGAIVTYTMPTFDDNCDGMGLTGTMTAGLASGSLFPIGTTTITYTYTDEAGNGPATCTFNVTVEDNFSATATGTNVSCNGGSDGTATANTTTGTSPYTYLWSNAATTQIITSLIAGTYTVTITDANGCSSSASIASITLTEPTTLSSSTSATSSPSCNGDSDGSIDLTVSGGTSPYTFNWEDNAAPGTTVSTVEDPMGLAAGTYNVTVTDTKGCTSTSAATINPTTILSTPTFSAANTAATICSGNEVNLTVTGGGGTANYNYEWSTGTSTIGTASTTDVITVPPGTYTVTITDANGCTVEGTYINNAALSGMTLSTSLIDVSCNGGSNGEIDLIVTDNMSGNGPGGTPLNVTYAWSNGATNEDLTGLTDGTYTVTVTDVTAACTVSITININEPATLSSSTTPTNVLCSGESTGEIDLTVTGGTTPYIYTWSNGATSEDLTGLAAGTYTVTITDANFCTSSTSETITEPATAVSATITAQTNVDCNGATTGNATVSATGGTGPYTYLWSDGQTTAATTSTLAAGTYTVTVTDGNMCTTTAVATITSPAGINLNSSQTNPACNGDTDGTATVAPSGGTAPYTYSWSTTPVQTTATATGLVGGTYTVIVTDANSCTSSTSVTIIEPTAISISIASTDIGCNGATTGDATATPSGGTGAYTYLWSNGGTTDMINTLAAGTYTVTVSDANSCTSSASVTISQTAGFTITQSTSDVDCNGASTGAATVGVSGGTAPYMFLWSDGQTTATASALMAGTYTVTISDNNTCSATASFTITEPTALASTISGSTNVLCHGATTGNATVTATGGTAGYTYSWSTAPAQTTQTATGLVAGTYTVTVTDSKACTSTSEVTITESSAVVITLAPTPVVCNNAGDGTIDATVTGGVSPYVYVWSNGSTNQDITGLVGGTYTVTVTDANLCVNTASVVITDPPSITTSISGSDITCNGFNNGSVNVTISGGVTPYMFAWSNSATTEDIFGLSPGTYTVTITDANGCTNILSEFIGQPSTLNVVISGTNASCANDGTISLSSSTTTSPTGGTSPYTYSWSTSATFIPFNTEDPTGLGTGTYTVTISDGNGCSTTRTQVINGPNNVTSAIVGTNVTCFGDSDGAVDLTITGGVGPFTYQWSNGVTTQDLSSLDPGTYTVTVTDQGVTCAVGPPAVFYTFTNSVTIVEQNLTVVIGKNDASCNGATDGNATASVTGTALVGGVPSVPSYSWSNGATTQTISSLTVGIYTVTVTDMNNCVSTAETTINEPSAIIITPTVTDVDCNGNTNGAISVTISGGNPNPNYSFTWSSNITTTSPDDPSTASASGLAADTYILTVTDFDGCTSTMSIVVSEPVTLTASTTPTLVICNGDGNGSITATPAGGTSPYTYLWNDGTTTQTNSGLTPGIYSVTVTDANNCVTNTSGTVTEPDAINIVLDSKTDVDCSGNSSGSATVTVSGGTAPLTYLWSNGGISTSISGISAGNYTITVTDANNCTDDFMVTINQPINAPTLTFNVTDIDCNGNANGAIDLDITGGTAPYTQLWTTGASSEDLTGLSAGSYAVNVTDANGCVITGSATVVEPAVLSATSTITPVGCNGAGSSLIDLTVTGGTSPYNYLWSNASSMEDLNGIAAGTYTVFITDANGCTESHTQTLTTPATLTVGTTQTNVNCFGESTGSVTAVESGGTSTYSYTWSDGQTTATATGLAAGTYTVTVTDANNCTASNSALITEPLAALSLTVTKTEPDCNGDDDGTIDLTVAGGTGPFGYSWTNGETTEDLSSLTPGTYMVTVTDANSCTATISMTIMEPTSISVSAIGSDASCNGGNDGSITAAVSGGTTPYMSFAWSDGGVGLNRTGLTAGTYTITVTDNNNCMATTSAIVGEPSVITISNIITNDVSCNGGMDGSISLSTSGGIAPYSYAWSNSAITEDISGLSAGTYTVTATDANLCTATTSVTISQPTAALAPNIISNDITCNGADDGNATSNPTGGTMPYSWSWNNGATSQSLSGLQPATYTVTVTDANMCATSSSITIAQPDVLSSTLTGSNTTCNGGSNGSLDLTVSGGTTGYTYSWSNGSTNQDLNSLTSGTYTVTITDSNGCTSSNSITITEPAAISIAIANTNVLCNGESNGTATPTASNGTSPYSYNWGTADPAALAAGTYTVTATDANMCTGTASVTITEPNVLAVTATSTNALCFGEASGTATPIATGGTSPYSYNWGTANPAALVAGTYTVTATDANLCTATTSVTISQPTAALNPNIDIFNDITCNGADNGNATSNPTGGTMPYDWNWSTGSASQSIFNLQPATYTVTVTDGNGCTSSEEVVITEPTVITSTFVVVDVDCNGGTSGSINFSVTGGTAPYTYDWDNDGTGDFDDTEDLSGLSEGTYNVTVQDANGCTAVDMVPISGPSNPLAVTATGTDALCNGGTGSATATATGGTSPYTYDWGTADPMALPAGTYIVTATDANMCTATASVTISQPANALTVTATGTNVLCAGNTGSATALATGGTSPYTYDWGTADPMALPAGTYIVTATDANMCTASGSVTITEPTALTASAIATSVACTTGTDADIDLTVSNGTSPYTYLWSNSATTEDIMGLGAGTYTVTVTDANMCTITTSASVSVTDMVMPTSATCQTDSTMTNDIDNCGAIFTYATPTFDDNCDGMGMMGTLVSGLASGSLFPVGSTTVVYEYTDLAGNGPVQCSFIVTVTDTQAPGFDTSDPNTPANGSTVIVDSNGGCNAIYSWTSPLPTDNCPGATIISETYTSPVTLPLGVYIDSIIVQDAAGNLDTMAFTFQIQDLAGTPPTASCTNNVILSIPAGQNSITVNPALIDNGSFGNCGAVTLAVSPSVFTCAQADGVTPHNIALIVTDMNGLSTTCNTTIIIQENTPPIMVCQDITVELDVNGNATIQPDTIDNGSSDACIGLASLTLDINSFNETNVGIANPVTLTGIDVNGNSASCTANVTVTPPQTCFSVDNNFIAGTGNNDLPLNTTNFVNVLGFQFTLEIDPLVASFTGVSNINPSISGSGTLTAQVIGSGDTIVISWFNTSSNPLTLNTATLFDINIDVIGAVGTVSDIDFIAAPLSSDVIVKYGTDTFSSSNGFPPCTEDGDIIVSSFATLPISGNVRTWGISEMDTVITIDNTDPMNPIMDTTITTTVIVPVQNVANVNIAKTEIDPFPTDTLYTFNSATTDVDGNYSAQVTNVVGGVDRLFLDPSKDTNWLNSAGPGQADVSSSDLFFIQQHIVGNILFTSIFEYLAADVNQDGEISTLDLVLIQDVILNPEGSTSPSIVIDTFSPWRFIPATDNIEMLTLPVFPLTNFIPSAVQTDDTIQFQNYSTPESNIDWIAIKIGQVFGSLNSSLFTSTIVEDRTGEDFVMSVENQKVTEDELISIPVYAKDYAAFIAWQFTLQFDESVLEFESFIPGAITSFQESGLGLNGEDVGVIGATWYGTPIEVANDEVLFTLQFRALENAAALSGLIDVNSRIVHSESSLMSGATGNVSLEFFTPTTTVNTEFALHQNRPNPFNGETLVSFNLPEAGFAKVTISDISGRTLKVIEGDYAKGYNEVRIQGNELSSTGVLYYQLESAEHIATKKMIILE